MKVKEAMNKGVLTVDPEIKPLDAFEKMYKEGVRRLFVLDDDRNPMGVVSYSDLIGVLGSLRPTNKDMSSIKISDIMSDNVMTIDIFSGIEDACQFNDTGGYFRASCCRRQYTSWCYYKNGYL